MVGAVAPKIVPPEIIVGRPSEFPGLKGLPANCDDILDPIRFKPEAPVWRIPALFAESAVVLAFGLLFPSDTPLRKSDPQEMQEMELENLRSLERVYKNNGESVPAWLRQMLDVLNVALSAIDPSPAVAGSRRMVTVASTETSEALGAAVEQLEALRDSLPEGSSGRYVLDCLEIVLAKSPDDPVLRIYLSLEVSLQDVLKTYPATDSNHQIIAAREGVVALVLAMKEIPNEGLLVDLMPRFSHQEIGAVLRQSLALEKGNIPLSSESRSQLADMMRVTGEEMGRTADDPLEGTLQSVFLLLAAVRRWDSPQLRDHPARDAFLAKVGAALRPYVEELGLSRPQTYEIMLDLLYEHLDTDQASESQFLDFLLHHGDDQAFALGSLYRAHQMRPQGNMLEFVREIREANEALRRARGVGALDPDFDKMLVDLGARVGASDWHPKSREDVAAQWTHIQQQMKRHGDHDNQEAFDAFQLHSDIDPVTSQVVWTVVNSKSLAELLGPNPGETMRGRAQDDDYADFWERAADVFHTFKATAAALGRVQLLSRGSTGDQEGYNTLLHWMVRAEKMSPGMSLTPRALGLKAAIVSAVLQMAQRHYNKAPLGAGPFARVVLLTNQLVRRLTAAEEYDEAASLRKILEEPSSARHPHTMEGVMGQYYGTVDAIVDEADREGDFEKEISMLLNPLEVQGHYEAAYLLGRYVQKVLRHELPGHLDLFEFGDPREMLELGRSLKLLSPTEERQLLEALADAHFSARYEGRGVGGAVD